MLETLFWPTISLSTVSQLHATTSSPAKYPRLQSRYRKQGAGNLAELQIHVLSKYLILRQHLSISHPCFQNHFTTRRVWHRWDIRASSDGVLEKDLCGHPLVSDFKDSRTFNALPLGDCWVVLSSQSRPFFLLISGDGARRLCNDPESHLFFTHMLRKKCMDFLGRCLSMVSRACNLHQVQDKTCSLATEYVLLRLYRSIAMQSLASIGRSEQGMIEPFACAHSHDMINHTVVAVISVCAYSSSRAGHLIDLNTRSAIAWIPLSNFPSSMSHFRFLDHAISVSRGMKGGKLITCTPCTCRHSLPPAYRK